ncbi:unannotated protein [freshwater metagenome]|uniref:Unannotated protein n=1 Tax=freshwater metagenome TaxID=449393 RepID=A0A6J6JZJ3_9ZZZZ
MEPGGPITNVSSGTLHHPFVFHQLVLKLQKGGTVLQCASSSSFPPATHHHKGADDSHQERKC